MRNIFCTTNVSLSFFAGFGYTGSYGFIIENDPSKKKKQDSSESRRRGSAIGQCDTFPLPCRSEVHAFKPHFVDLRDSNSNAAALVFPVHELPDPESTCALFFRPNHLPHCPGRSVEVFDRRVTVDPEGGVTDQERISNI